MVKNIVKIEMEKMGITENVVDNIMSYHGGLDAMLPEQYTPEDIKSCLRKDNWKLEIREFEGDGYLQVDYKIIVDIDKNNMKSAYNNCINLYYKYPTKYEFMYGINKIDNIFGNFIQMGKLKFNIDNFEYLRTQHSYKSKFFKRNE